MLLLQLVGNLILFLSVAPSAHGLGIAYDPLHSTNYNKDLPGVLIQDFQQMSIHFDSIRTYSSLYGDVAVGPYLKLAGLKASLGIPMGNGDEQRQIAAAINAAEDPSHYVNHIFVGNENMVSYENAKQIATLIKQVKDTLASKGLTHVKVGTVQRPNELLGNIPGVFEVVEACDILGVNIYPFFSQLDHSNPIGDVDMLRIQYNQIVNKYPNANVLVAETGWSTGGGYNAFGNTGDANNAERYLLNFMNYFFTPGYPGEFMKDAFYFQYYDTPYKNDPVENHFGIADYQGNLKFNNDLMSLVAKNKNINQFGTQFGTASNNSTKKTTILNRVPSPSPSRRTYFRTSFALMRGSTYPPQ